jgi:hypothetical protein
VSPAPEAATISWFGEENAKAPEGKNDRHLWMLGLQSPDLTLLNPLSGSFGLQGI